MPNGPTSKDDKRRRGVQASKVKLQHALAESGLKTQTAVAERIADQESLDTAPRGLVNKVFRGEPVDPRSIERIARALGVDAWTLYRSSDETGVDIEPPEPEPVIEGSGPPPRNGIPAAAFAMLAVILVITALVFLRTGADLDAESPPAPKPRSMQPTVVVLPVAGARGDVVFRELSIAIDRAWRVIPNPLPDEASDPQRVLSDSGVDHVIATRVDPRGRWLQVAVDLHLENSMTTVWRGEVRANAAEATVGEAMQRVAATIHAGTTTGRDAQVQESYLEGRAALDEVRTELNVRRALTAFERSIRADATFANAYAGLCEALIQDHVRTGDADILDDAAAQCGKALELDEDSVEARRVQGYLLRKRGELEEARSLFEDVLALQPRNTDALIQLAEVHLTRFLNAEEDGVATALEILDEARAAEPDFWKVPFTRARVLYFSGNLEAAVDAAAETARLDPNVLALSNLGSFRYCQGDFAGAKDAYEAAKATDPASFVGEGQLAVVHYYLRDFDASVTAFETALELHRRAGRAEEHRLWGNFAHALRQADRDAEAADAYARAILLAEEADAGGDGNPVHGVYLAFYREMLYWMTRDSAVQRASDDQLEHLAATQDPISQLYLAILFELRGDSETALDLKERGSRGCPGFAQSPDFELESIRG